MWNECSLFDGFAAAAAAIATTSVTAPERVPAAWGPGSTPPTSSPPHQCASPVSLHLYFRGVRKEAGSRIVYVTLEEYIF